MVNTEGVPPSAESSRIPLRLGETTGMMRLPTELLLQVMAGMGEEQLWALTLTNRRLSVVANALLWAGLHNDPKRSKEVLLWAVEAGNHELLRHMLQNGNDPNFLFLSGILRSRLRDVLSTQGRRHDLYPRLISREMVAEVFRQEYCGCRTERNLIWPYQRKERLDSAITYDNLDLVVEEMTNQFPSALSLWHGIDEIWGDIRDHRYWSWGPLHVAAFRGDNAALELLLDHGANINAQYDLYCEVEPHHNRVAWTALHVAMCEGHDDTVRLLVARGISGLVGARVYPVPDPTRYTPPIPETDWTPSMTAFHNAAWIGSATNCQLFLETHRFHEYLNESAGVNSAVHLAAAGGNIRTAGRLLLDVVRPPDAVLGQLLEILCKSYQFGDAEWLVDFYAGALADGRIDTCVFHQRALAVLCEHEGPTIYSKLSNRQRQDRLYSLTPGQPGYTDYSEYSDCARAKKEQDIQNSLGQRLSLANKFLALGADPNAVQPTTVPRSQGASFYFNPMNSERHDRTLLQIAASWRFTEMIQLLLKFGANPLPVSDAQQDECTKRLPVIIAARHAAREDSGSESCR
ncbi:ankyrin repeat-containing domain protein [Dichotomopilus funicola]|uniref:Ankyrin repeat-containing domain protein n=1 Tax=Dichotomopilus funicola TaxID=1934379 RepID=A0AAN6ZMU6_9PEZI|nr:ankyrin repeat-containing domain protein [Dichotomopilus funicola]